MNFYFIYTHSYVYESINLLYSLSLAKFRIHSSERFVRARRPSQPWSVLWRRVTKPCAKTAHPALSVSEDRKQVRHTDKLQEVSENPKRFDRVPNILAKESFSSGRCYWEVEVGEKIEWNLGIVRQSINRKGKFTVCPANGFWTLGLKASGQYLAYTSPVTHLALDHRTKRVGVFLDYSEGRVSFYCAESGAHIYTFDDKFTDRLHPFFSPGRLHGGKNLDGCCWLGRRLTR
uniref:B30.2/SPRY domain-containing protein n=1 Tax=Periophthalmus magnuspinnatus TaxID=409849 RepID=A0A3B3ZQT5_9GOBI